MIQIKIIDEAHKQDINIPNQPFQLIGKLIPSYVDEQWHHTIHLFDNQNISQMCFPDENYNYAEMKNSSIFIGAYENDRCVGLAILQQAWFKYMYLYDLKVLKTHRQKGIASALIQKACQVCKDHHYDGIYAQAQDNNLIACLFYLKAGFRIGGLDTNIYKGTNQEGKADILFYLDC